MRIYLRTLACFLFLLSIAAFGQTNTTTTSSSASTEVIPGSTPSLYFWTTTIVGPQTIRIGNQTACTATIALPPAGCTPGSGTGTPGDPLLFSCGVIPLTGCTGGSLLTIVPGGEDINTFGFLVLPSAQSAVNVQPVPLSLWMPIGSAIGVALLAIALQFRQRRRSR